MWEAGINGKILLKAFFRFSGDQYYTVDASSQSQEAGAAAPCNPCVLLQISKCLAVLWLLCNTTRKSTVYQQI